MLTAIKPTVLDALGIFCGAWVLSGKFGALRPEARKFESHLRKDLGQVLHLQLPVVLWRVNSNTVSLLYLESASE